MHVTPPSSRPSPQEEDASTDEEAEKGDPPLKKKQKRGPKTMPYTCQLGCGAGFRKLEKAVAHE